MTLFRVNYDYPGKFEFSVVQVKSRRIWKVYVRDLGHKKKS
jgi:hypothetical protein